MKATIQYQDFEKLELRVGQVIAAVEPEWSHKLLQFTVDFGSEIGQKTILSGVKKWYSAADFIGKKFPFVINLEERKMGEGVSQGMMMMADVENGEDSRPIITPFPDEIPVGSNIR